MCPQGREQEQGGTILKGEMQMKVLKEKKKGKNIKKKKISLLGGTQMEF